MGILGPVKTLKLGWYIYRNSSVTENVTIQTKMFKSYTVWGGGGFDSLLALLKEARLG